ncbi:ABC transporter ATP-binding protein [Gordonia rubripertincta]|uniref:ABC transporter ATP-binding protein n=1 Tax=Gordonia rubripertincta TaxID=36822 RepID=UPI000B8D20D6|nr:ABC transporter ATP-binding protein [Gordonia rubripertincta]ASR01696.1 Aliphatic sulfonates import ATP-binding protein SsuB [Gordonia rubripertincta]
MSRSDEQPIVDVRGVRRVFDGRAVLDGIDLSLRTGDFVALLGPSGTGKTTLLRILAGLDTADDGTVIVPHSRSVVFQEPRLVAARKVWRNVIIGARKPRRERSRAVEALAEVGLADHADAWPVTLSGGEAQRVALARALVTEPGLLLLDEPFAALDALTRIKMQALVAELIRRHQPAALLVTHDVDEAILLADRILILADGSIDVDVRVDVDRRLQRDDPRFVELRAHLLDKLGVRATTEPAA